MIVLFYKEKGFYISLACGIVALVAFAAICMNLMSDDTGNSDESPIVAEATPTPAPTKEPETEDVLSQDVLPEVAQPTKKPKAKATPEAVETDVKPVKNKLHFDQEAGLLWPVNGEVLMEYSADKVVYFKTLAQYRRCSSRQRKGQK